MDRGFHHLKLLVFVDACPAIFNSFLFYITVNCRPAARRWWAVRRDLHRKTAALARVPGRLRRDPPPRRGSSSRPPSTPRLKRAEGRPQPPLPLPLSWIWRWCRTINNLTTISIIKLAKWLSPDLCIRMPLTALPHLPSTLPVSESIFHRLFCFDFFWVYRHLVQASFPIFPTSIEFKICLELKKTILKTKFNSFNIQTFNSSLGFIGVFLISFGFWLTKDLKKKTNTI